MWIKKEIKKYRKINLWITILIGETQLGVRKENTEKYKKIKIN